jgi:UDP-N-acetylglucosamine 2-epimerase (non-hydrolysing)
MTFPTVYVVAGARPNFMKIAPIVRALRERGQLRWKIVHTGQHYDRDMNDVFFEELGIPAPDHQLDAGGGTHAQQTGRIMVAFEQLCMESRPDCVLVVGDVNSTLACAVVAKKLGIRVAHVEAGLRSGDLTMPEEINRLVTDAISDWFFVTEPSGAVHLKQEGKPAERIHEVGHVMVDNLLFQAAKLETMNPELLDTSALKRRHPRYGVVTLHRPSNVDDPEALARMMSALNRISQTVPLFFPVHPRTQNNLARFEIHVDSRVELMKPQPYMAFLNLWKDAAVVLTDSGGLQEETTALGVPCVTIRENTERPVTVDEGTNMLAGTDPDRVVELALQALAGKSKRGRRPHLWDGHAAVRIVDILTRHLTPQ